MLTYPEAKAKIESALQALNPSAEPVELYEPIRYILSLGGKRLRPALLLLANDLFHGDIENALPAALGIEVFHNFTLVHDDIMDEAPLRRGKATVHNKWNRDIAILSGDVMFVQSFQYMMQSTSDHPKEVLQLFTDTAIEVCEGQQYDMNFETSSSVSIADYMEMIRLKTAVLLAASLKVGALLAQASSKDAELIYQFGEQIGIAFQLQDDILDAFADPDQFGKRVGGDIVSNKKTFLLLSAIEAAEGEQKATLTDALNNKWEAEEKVARVLSVYQALGIREKAEARMNEHFALGLKALDEIEVAQEKKAVLLQLATQLMKRQS